MESLLLVGLFAILFLKSKPPISILPISQQFSTLFIPSKPSGRFISRIDLLIHGIEEYSITLRGMHLLQEKLHALDRVHGLKHLSQEPDTIQIVRV